MTTVQKKHFPHIFKWVVPIQCYMDIDVTVIIKNKFYLFYNGL